MPFYAIGPGWARIDVVLRVGTNPSASSLSVLLGRREHPLRYRYVLSSVGLGTVIVSSLVGVVCIIFRSKPARVAGFGVPGAAAAAGIIHGEDAHSIPDE
jgi:hypothetical protein